MFPIRFRLQILMPLCRASNDYPNAFASHVDPKANVDPEFDNLEMATLDAVEDVRQKLGTTTAPPADSHNW